MTTQITKMVRPLDPQALIEAHDKATTRVHGVGASNVESTAGAQAKADAVRANLDAHTARTDNPHQVTAAQVGAPPQATFDAKFDPTTGHKHTDVAGDGPKLTHDAVDTAKVSAFRAHQSAAQSVAASTETVVAYQTEVFDQLNEYNPATYGFTPSKSGIYLVTGAAKLTGYPSGSSVFLGIRKNGIRHSVGVQISSAITGEHAVYVSSPVQLNAGDYVDIIIWASRNATTSSTDYMTYFTAVRIA